jgi:hypothetical protein
MRRLSVSGRFRATRPQRPDRGLDRFRQVRPSDNERGQIGVGEGVRRFLRRLRRKVRFALRMLRRFDSDTFWAVPIRNRCFAALWAR